MQTRNAFIAISLSAALSAASTGAWAGKAVISSAEGDESVFEYNRSMLRFGAGDDSGYAVVRDGSFYTVVQDDGQTMVFDAGSMMQGLGDAIGAAAPTDLDAEVVSLEKTGATETVAGIKGSVYELQFIDDDGKKRTEELVLSTDRRARELRDALFLMMESMAKITSGTDAKNAREMWDRLSDLDSGVLRFGQDMVVSSIDGERVDDARFELPAAPMDMQAIGAMLSGMSQSAPSDNSPDSRDEMSEQQQQTQGGFLSGVMGAIGGQAERQTERQSDRVGDTVEQEIDESADEGVDKAIGKAFGKLFGRN